jgi:phage I-like protein
VESVDRRTLQGGALGPFVREQMLSHLREAQLLVEDDSAERLERVRELVGDVAERIDAALLASVTAGRVRSELRCAALAATAEPAREFLLIPFGEVTVERPIAGESFVFTERHAASAKRWFDTLGRKLAIDYEHQSFARLNRRGDGLRPAAGGIGGLEVREDGLWAVNVTWTDRAAELLRSGEYRYFSPVIFWTDEDHSDVAALGPVALTNDPAMHGVQALATSERESAVGGLSEPDRPQVDSTQGVCGTEGSDGERDQGIEEGDFRSEIPEEDLKSEISEGDLKQGPQATSALLKSSGTRHAEPFEARLSAAEAELAVLRREVAAQRAEAFVERGLRLGKILESTAGDWRDDFLRDAAIAEARLARTPVILPPGRVTAPGDRDEASRGVTTSLAADKRSAVEPEDLRAYEEAAAAGRVRG